MALMNLAGRDRHNEPVLEVDGLYAVPTTLEYPIFERLTLDGGKLYLAVDEEGRLSLDTLFKKKPSSGPSKPDVFSLNEVSVTDFSVALATPFLDLDVGPLRGTGFAWQKADGSRAGTVDATISTFSIAPKLKELSAYAEAVFERKGPLVFGPLEGMVDWVGPKVTLRRFRLAFPGLELVVSGEVDVTTLFGEVNVSVRAEGADAASIAARVAKDGWTLSGLVNSVTVPRASVSGLEVPGVALQGATFNASGKTASLSLSRLFVDGFEQDGLAARGVAVSGAIRFRASAPFEELLSKLEQVEGEWDRIGYLLKGWGGGDIVLSVLVDELAYGGRSLARPVRVKFNARPGPEGTVGASLRLGLHPLGAVTAEMTLKPAGESGRTGYAAVVKIDDLDITPLVKAADPPMMLKRMLSGKLKGGITFYCPDLGSPMIVVKECRFDLEKEAGGGVVIKCPEGEQKWDLSVDPEVSLFKKEISFGEGKLNYELTAP